MHSTRVISRMARRTRIGGGRGYASAASQSQPPLVGLSSTQRAHAEKISAEWKGTSATGGNTKNFIGGEFVESKAEAWIDVVDPVRTIQPHSSLDSAESVRYFGRQVRHC